MSVLETLSGLAVQHLRRDRLLALRNRYHAMRRRFQPALKLLNGTFRPVDLRRHLEERVGRDFEILMVHSSTNRMAPMFVGGPLDLLAVLVEFCGPDRTLAMPAFCFGDSGAHDVASFYESKPHFDVRRTPSQMGIVTELFRRSPGVRQSHHPTHRIAARGPLAEPLTAGHSTASSTFGRGTPFEFMAARDTLILGIGKPFEVLTQVHHVEDLLDEAFPVPSQVRRVSVTMRDEQGNESPYGLGVRQFQRRRDMWKLRAIMSRDRLREWKFHGVPLFAVRARHVTDDLMAAARHGATVFKDAHR